jgi:energy-coupling factor transporter ATP-binding protein EcfA2
MGLAPQIVDSLFEEVAKLRAEGLSILLVEQRVEHALRLADYVILMYKGNIRAVGEPKDIEDKVTGAYLGSGKTEILTGPGSGLPLGDGFVRTEYGTLRHHAHCVVARTSASNLSPVGAEELPPCGLCFNSSEDVEEPKLRIGA